MRCIRVIPLAFVLALFVGGCKKDTPAAKGDAVRPGRVMTLKKGTGEKPLVYPGHVKAGKEADVSFQVDGPLIELNVKEGDELKKGQVIARIKPRDYEVRLNRVKSQLAATKAQEKAMKAGARPEDVQKLKAQVEKAQAALRLAEKEKIRVENMVKENAASQRALDTRIEGLEKAKADLKLAKESLNIGLKGARAEDIEKIEAEVRKIEVQLKDAEYALADTVLKAPFEGRVVKKYVENHEEVRAKQPIVQIQNEQRVDVVFYVPEKIVLLYPKGREGRFQVAFDELPDRTFEAELKEIRLKADPRSSTFQVVLTMAAPAGINAMPGMSVNVHVFPPATTKTKEQAFLVPACAVFADEQGQYYAWRVKKGDMTVEKIKVQVGAPSGENIPVNGGLAEGDMILTAGVHYVQPGTKIRPFEKKK